MSMKEIVSYISCILIIIIYLETLGNVLLVYCNNETYNLLRTTSNETQTEHMLDWITYL